MSELKLEFELNEKEVKTKNKNQFQSWTKKKFICLVTLNSRVSIITFINFDMNFFSLGFVIITVLLPMK